MLKQLAIGVWLLLIGGFAPPPQLVVRGDDKCRRLSTSLRVQYAARFYELVAHLLFEAINDQNSTSAQVVFGDLLLEELHYLISRVRGMTYDVAKADQWENLVLKHTVVQHIYFLTSEAIACHQAYTTMRAENNFQMQLVDAQLADENIFEIMCNVHDYFPLPALHSEIVKYELLGFAELPLFAYVDFDETNKTRLFLNIKYRYTKFFYDADVAENTNVIGHFRTPVECRRDLNVLNDYTILFRALNDVAHVFDALGNRSRSLTYSDKFLAIVSPSTLAYAQEIVRKLFADSPLTAIVEYQFITTNFLRILTDFILREYNWQRCHPIRHVMTQPTKLWAQIVVLVNKNFMSSKKAYDVYVKSRDFQDKTSAMLKCLQQLNVRIGFSLRADVGVAIAIDGVERCRSEDKHQNVTTTAASEYVSQANFSTSYCCLAKK